MTPSTLLGIGLYTPAEAERLIRVPAGKIARWLKGHSVKGKRYEPLWHPQINLGDDHVYLGFRDLMEMRTAHAFMEKGVSAVAIRRAIVEASKLVGDERPLSTTKFRTDGRSIFLEIAREDGDAQLVDIFRRQYAFQKIIEQSLTDVDFDGIAPGRWWPASRAKGIVVDPARSFGQPIDEETGVPTAALAAAVQAEGSIEAAARAWQVRPSAVKRAAEFEAALLQRAA
ncbi:hypothetical protein KXS07_15340 [Inquilinus limosus]|uniref:hypothetical protein n=1 Tax=Inquilinus limosus TaxID=171674 RepID=UPI0009DBFF5D|nr:hypothetical protein [Inquilinus limosus]